MHYACAEIEQRGDETHLVYRQDSIELAHRYPLADFHKLVLKGLYLHRGATPGLDAEAHEEKIDPNERHRGRGRWLSVLIVCSLL